MAQDAVGGDFGEGDFGDQLRLDPMRALRSARGTSSAALFGSSGSSARISSSISLALKPVPTFPA